MCHSFGEGDEGQAGALNSLQTDRQVTDGQALDEAVGNSASPC